MTFLRLKWDEKVLFIKLFGLSCLVDWYLLHSLIILILYCCFVFVNWDLRWPVPLFSIDVYRYLFSYSLSCCCWCFWFFVVWGICFFVVWNSTFGVPSVARVSVVCDSSVSTVVLVVLFIFCYCKSEMSSFFFRLMGVVFFEFLELDFTLWADFLSWPNFSWKN